MRQRLSERALDADAAMPDAVGKSFESGMRKSGHRFFARIPL